MDIIRALAKQNLQLSFRTLRDEGIINNRLIMYHQMKRQDDSFSFVQLITSFFTNAVESMGNMLGVLKNGNLDFAELEELAINFKANTMRVGVEGISNAIDTLYEAIDARSNERCVAAVQSILTQLATFGNRMQEVLQFERRIILGR